MKQTIICAIIALTLVACSNQPGFTIKGNCGDYDGIAVLSYLNPLDETKVSDTVVMTAGAFEFNGNVAAVSYTHLDVYKRQALRRARCAGQCPQLQR